MAGYCLRTGSADNEASTGPKLVAERWRLATGPATDRLRSVAGKDRVLVIDLSSTAERVAFDLETTGLKPGADRIVEIGAVRFAATGEILDRFERLVNPLRPSAAAARLIHGISDDLLADAALAHEVLPEFVHWLGDPSSTILVAHHAALDAGFLGNELIRSGLPLPGHDVVDTLAWSRRCWPTFGNHRLDSLARRFGLDVGASHRALADSLRVRRVLLTLQASNKGQDRPPLAYPIHDGAGPPPIPCGWADVAHAIDHAGMIQIEYLGGSRGPGPRAVTPQRFVNRGGVAYLVASCHLDHKTKEFQVDRIRSAQVVTGGESPRIRGGDNRVGETLG